MSSRGTFSEPLKATIGWLLKDPSFSGKNARAQSVLKQHTNKVHENS